MGLAGTTGYDLHWSLVTTCIFHILRPDILRPEFVIQMMRTIQGDLTTLDGVAHH